MAKTKKPSVKAPVSYPNQVLEPVSKYLKDKLSILESKRSKLQKDDPFNDASRLNDNAAIDSDAAEQVGHMQVSAVRGAYDRTIIQVRKALSRLKMSKYGICENCGQMIDTDRLMIVPETTLCVSCEKKREKK